MAVVPRKKPPVVQKLNRESFVGRVNEWIEWLHRTRHISGSTSEVYTRICRSFAVFVKSKEISSDLVERWLFELRDAGNSDNRLRCCRTTIKQFFDWAVERGYVNDNPAKELRIRISTPPPKTDTFTKDEYEKIKAAAHLPKYRYAVIMAYSTGMRISDVCNLKWSNIDLVNEMITFVPWKVRRHKTKVTIPIIAGSDLADLIYELARDIPVEDGLLMPDLKLDNLRMWFHDVLKKLGIEGKSFHTFRRTFVSNVISSGVDSWIAMKMVGIKKQETMKHYAVPHIDSLRDAMVKALKFAERT